MYGPFEQKVSIIYLIVARNFLEIKNYLKLLNNMINENNIKNTVEEDTVTKSVEFGKKNVTGSKNIIRSIFLEFVKKYI